jgi:hypothetical protein
MLLPRAGLVPNAATNLTVIGSFADVIRSYKTVKPAKSGLGWNLIDEKGEIHFVGRSKALSAEIAAGRVKANQLEHCVVIDGKNAQGQERFYLALPVDYRGAESVDEFLKKISGGGRPRLAFDAQAAALAI